MFPPARHWAGWCSRLIDFCRELYARLSARRLMILAHVPEQALNFLFLSVVVLITAFLIFVFSKRPTVLAITFASVVGLICLALLYLILQRP